MATFQYVAWDQMGNCEQGTKQASSEEELLAMLKQEQLTPVSITESKKAPREKRATVRAKRIKSGDLATFCWQLSTMLGGGLPITSAIETIADEIPNPYLEFILKEIAGKLAKGLTLSECMQEYPKVFSHLSCAMIMAGETGGSLTATLTRLAEHYENRDKLIRKVRGAMAYPIFVIIFIVLIVIVLMTLIIPRFSSMFEEFEGELPAFTRGFMAVYNVIMHNVPYILIAGAIVAVGLVAYSKTEKGHEKFSKLILSLPVFGKIILMAFVAMFCKTLGTLVAAGVPVLEAFQILSGMTQNEILRKGVMETRDKMVEGLSISRSMEKAGFFPGVAVKMAQIGENSGSLSSVMEKTSDYYEKKVDGLVSLLLGMLEPILIICVGAIVLVVILAMYLPIFSMGG